MNRTERIINLRKSGETLQEIGNIFNISRERVRQIIKKQSSFTGKQILPICRNCNKETNYIKRGFCGECRDKYRRVTKTITTKLYDQK